jgi:D-sedoheptulose 7-phosphate isomerase
MFSNYIEMLSELVTGAVVTDEHGQELPLEPTVRSVGSTMKATHDAGKKILFAGNGGSAGICSHMATDYSKNGNMRAMALNDGAILTCLSNDLGYEQVFAKQIEWYAHSGDLLVAISSSGSSPNILNAVASARQSGCRIVTFSGFKPMNPLRSAGDINFYVNSSEYGFVEVGHLAILHGILDIQMGWQAELQQSSVA